MLISTYDVTEMVVEEAIDQFHGKWVISENNKNYLKEVCSLIDRIVDEFDGESAEASIDDETLKLKISIVCPDMILEYGRTHPFFTLIKHTESFGFSTVDDSLKIDFVFAGLWEHKD